MSRLSTCGIEGDRFWHELAENGACRVKGVGLVYDHLRILIDDVVGEVPSENELGTIDLDQAEIRGDPEGERSQIDHLLCAECLKHPPMRCLVHQNSL